ncbi:MAG: bestrophin family protein [Flavobacteriales bacterium]
MIEYDNKNWFGFLLKRSGYHYDGVLWSLLLYGVISAALTYLHLNIDWKIFHIPATFHTVLGLVIGLLLVFRTNTAYERWWEGRRQLGGLVNTSRNCAMKYKSYINNDPVIFKLLIAFPWAMKVHLRDKNFADASKFLPASLVESFLKSGHKPNFILLELSIRTNNLYKSGTISGEQLIVLETKINELTDILGACERIHNTPIPFGYALHLKRILLIYLVTLPFAFIDSLNWWSIPVVMVVFYTMIGIELIAEEIEDPFGTDVNDLPFDELAEKIKANIEEIEKQ